MYVILEGMNTSNSFSSFERGIHLSGRLITGNEQVMELPISSQVQGSCSAPLLSLSFSSTSAAQAQCTECLLVGQKREGEQRKQVIIHISTKAFPPCMSEPLPGGLHQDRGVDTAGLRAL